MKSIFLFLVLGCLCLPEVMADEIPANCRKICAEKDGKFIDPEKCDVCLDKHYQGAYKSAEKNKNQMNAELDKNIKVVEREEDLKRLGPLVDCTLAKDRKSISCPFGHYVLLKKRK